MDAELYKVATRGSISFLDDATISNRGEDYFLSKSSEGNNIIHLAAQHGCADFITLALTRFPTQLVLQKNIHGDTPLHVSVATRRSDETVKVLISHLKDIAANATTSAANAAANATTNAAAVVPFFMVENELGDTPFHVALKNVNLQAAQLFLGTIIPNHLEILSTTNKFKETPLHLFVRYCTAEVCDKEGRNVLHLITLSSEDYKDLKQLMALPEISVLKDRQDCQGNTPAHCSVFGRDLSKLRVLSESLADLTIRNNKELSVRDLISQEPDQNMKQILETVSIGRIMDEGLYKAAQEGDTSVLPQQGHVLGKNDHRLCQAHDGSNIIHLAIRHGQIIFVDEVLSSFPTLIFQKDLNGDTPLHIAARLRTPAALMFLNLSCGVLWKKTLQHQKLSFCCPPWMVKSSRGNTLLHEAARTSNYNAISSLLIYMDLEDVSNANYNGETSLHLFTRYCTYAATDTLENVKELVERSSAAAYITDVDGLTPVSRAAQCGRFRVAKMVLSHYPLSAKIPDHHGKIFLHHLKPSVTELVDDSISILHLWEEIFSFPIVDELRTVQDHDGNTPLHTAIINSNIAAIKFLMSRCLKSDRMEELSIINNHGDSVFQLLASEADIPHMKEIKELVTVTKSYIKERELERQKLDDNLYEMVIRGELDILDPSGAVSMVINIGSGSSPYEDRDFLRATPDGSNILHIALKYSDPKPAVDFVKKALNRFPSLILQLDCNGDTPLHIAAKGHNPASIAIAERIKTDFEKVRDEDRQGVYVAPWKHKNCRGNMPIHEAIQGINMKVSNLLLDIDPDMTSYVNDLGETPLHVFAKYGQSCTENTSAAYMRDGEGLTPILRAAQSGRLGAVRSILERMPQTAYHRDSNGKTLLHLLRFTDGDLATFSFGDMYKLMENHLFKRPDIDAQLSLQDNDGDTALHSAIKTSNSVMVDTLVERISRSSLEDRYPLINLANKGGHTVLDLLASKDDHDTISRLRARNRTSNWPTDSYRVPEATIRDTIQSLSVVAGLLAAITFAAALQVPGGFDSKSGSPIALKKAAFKVFLLSDTIAMCVSMMVLYCLVWAISSTKIKDRRLFLDFSMDLLLIAFMATLIAFMTGVYAVTAERTLWLSILVCVFCSGAFLYRSRGLIMILHQFKAAHNLEILQPGITEPLIVKIVAEVLQYVQRRPFVLFPTTAALLEMGRRILF
ncbi:hypothetical protein KSS87_008592 [Heliosperma pusillum]|nr:hypothetical protein KSS87_008592 [Heliosperma pusillum]